MGWVVCGTDKEIKLAAKEGCNGRRLKIQVKPLLNNPVNWIRPTSDHCHPMRESRAWARVVLFSRWHFEGSGRDNCIIQGMIPGSQQPEGSEQEVWMTDLAQSSAHAQINTGFSNVTHSMALTLRQQDRRVSSSKRLFFLFFLASSFYCNWLQGQKVVHRVLQQKRGCNTRTFRLKCALLITC